MLIVITIPVRIRTVITRVLRHNKLSSCYILQLHIIYCFLLHLFLKFHFLGPYNLHELSQKRPKLRKSGHIAWETKNWAGVLDYADFLHINTVGSDPKDGEIIKKIVTDLELSNHHKIRFNFNQTFTRGHYRGTTDKERAGKSQLNYFVSLL